MLTIGALKAENERTPRQALKLYIKYLTLTGHEWVHGFEFVIFFVQWWIRELDRMNGTGGK